MNLLLDRQHRQKLDHFQWKSSRHDQAISCEQDDFLHDSQKNPPSHLYMQIPSNAVPLNSSLGVLKIVIPYIAHLWEPRIHQPVARANYAQVNPQRLPGIQVQLL